ncbi:hypothetical protein QOZ80_2AG0150450 [Eleusine coracana subsp. coracana]|nr:hypothetical protein QOZ80_2AG0150450 [Eleusine coracana subsp. coracana]
MSSKVMITYKRKRVTSRRDTANETLHDSSAAASNNVVASSFPSKYETDAENNVEDEDNLPTSTKENGVCMSASQIIKDELANESTHAGEKKLQLCESLLQKKQSEICCASTKQHGVCMPASQIIEDELANQSTYVGEKKLQLCESLLQKEQPEICCASTKQHDVCMPASQIIKYELANQSTHAGEKKLQLCESLLQKEQPEICCVASGSTTEAQSYKLQCTDDTNSPNPVSSSVCDSMDLDGMTNRTEDSKASALLEMNSYQVHKIPVRSDQCKSRFSPLLTFRRRVKKKKISDETAEENCSPDNKQCSALTCSPPSSSLDATHLLKHTGLKTSDIEPKEAAVGSSGLPIQAEHLHEQESLHIIKSSVQHIFPSQIAEDVNQLEHNGTPVSKFTGVVEVSEKYARVENSSKTLSGAIEVPEVIAVQEQGHANGQTSSLQSPRQVINVSWLKPTNKSVAEDLLESQGSTKHIPVIVLDEDSDEKGKEPENSDVHDKGVQNKNKSKFSLGKIDLNCAELRQEEPPLHLDYSCFQWLPDQGQFGNASKQMSQPIERMFFTKEKDTMLGKRQQHEGSSTIPTLYSNRFDQTSCWNTGNFKAPSLPSELKFRIMDKVPEFNLDLSLDSFPDNSVSSRRRNKLFLGRNPVVSHKLTENLGTYSYKRHSAPWSEEELDFLWIGVRRYGVNNWNAMLRDTRLRFSNSRTPDDLAKQWDKEQKKLLGADFFQSMRTPGLVPAPPSHIAEDYLGRGSCSGCSKSLFLAAQTDLSLGDVYLQNVRGPGRGEHHLSNLDMLNLHRIDSAPRNLSLGGFPGASSSHGRSSGRRRRASKFHKSYYDKASWFQEPSGRLPQLLPIVNQQPMNNGLPQWLTKDAETGRSRVNPEMWPSMAPPPGHLAADPPSDNLRGASLFIHDMPHVLPEASLKRTMRNADWRSFSKRLFRTGDALDLSQGAAGPNGATASGTGASSEETVSDS